MVQNFMPKVFLSMRPITYKEDREMYLLIDFTWISTSFVIC